MLSGFKEQRYSITICLVAVLSWINYFLENLLSHKSNKRLSNDSILIFRYVLIIVDVGYIFYIIFRC